MRILWEPPPSISFYKFLHDDNVEVKETDADVIAMEERQTQRECVCRPSLEDGIVLINKKGTH